MRSRDNFYCCFIPQRLASSRTKLELKIQSRNPNPGALSVVSQGLHWWEAGSRSQNKEWKPGTLILDAGLLLTSILITPGSFQESRCPFRQEGRHLQSWAPALPCAQARLTELFHLHESFVELAAEVTWSPTPKGNPQLSYIRGAKRRNMSCRQVVNAGHGFHHTTLPGWF